MGQIELCLLERLFLSYSDEDLVAKIGRLESSLAPTTSPTFRLPVAERGRKW